MNATVINSVNQSSSIDSKHGASNVPMVFTTTLYPSSNGFVLIDNFVVPFEFLEKLHFEVENWCFGIEQVTHIQDNCSAEFWESLSDDQRSVFGPCLLILIENGLDRKHHQDAILYPEDQLY